MSARAARAAIGLLIGSMVAAAPARPAAGARWVDTWAAAPDTAGRPLAGQTVRQIVRAGIGGSSVRLRLSNLFGTGSVAIGPVHIARQAAGAEIRPGTDRVVTFAGRPVVTIPRGADALSDPIAFPVTALERLAVSLYLPRPTGPSTLHGDGSATAYLTASGDATAATKLPAGDTSGSRFFLTDVEVSAGAGAGARALVIVGDSITDGYRSTRDRDARWPDALASRLQADPRLASIAVVNEGISGNRLLHDGPVGRSVLSRFDRDALGRPGVRWILLQTGINDIGISDAPEKPEDVVSAEQVIDGLKSLIARAHAKGVRIWGATLLPYAGAVDPLRWSPGGEAKRQAVNRWIRTSGAFDAVVDFERMIRDPGRPERMIPALDSGDHLHPNDAGYQAMAGSIDMRLFTRDEGGAIP